MGNRKIGRSFLVSLNNSKRFKKYIQLMWLVEKHPETDSFTKDLILEGPLLKIHQTAYAEIDSPLQLYRLLGVQFHLVWMLMSGEMYLHYKILKIMDKTLENLWLQCFNNFRLILRNTIRMWNNTFRQITQCGTSWSR